MQTICLSLATGSSLAGRAFSNLFTTFNAALARHSVNPGTPDFLPVAVVVHVSGQITDWQPTAPGRVVRHRKPPSLEVSVVVPRSAWEDLTRNQHREALITAVTSGVDAAIDAIPPRSRASASAELRAVLLPAVRELRSWSIPADPLLGPPATCPKCGARLRTRVARQCHACGADWHDPGAA